MNYIEQVLERSDDLWRVQEQTLLGSPARAGKVSAAAEETAENDAAEQLRRPEKSGVSAGTREGGGTDEKEALRAQERMEEPMTRFDRSAVPEEYRRRLTETLLSNADERAPIHHTELPPRQEESGVRYLVRMLQSGSMAGLFGTKETPDVTVSEIVREGLDAQTLSRGLERDARRYDGGFLLY